MIKVKRLFISLLPISYGGAGDYLHEINLIYGPELEDVVNIAVVWEVIDEDQYVKQIYNHDTGEIYFDEAEEMTDEVDDFISSILMYGNLEQTIG